MAIAFHSRVVISMVVVVVVAVVVVTVDVVAVVAWVDVVTVVVATWRRFGAGQWLAVVMRSHGEICHINNNSNNNSVQLQWSLCGRTSIEPMTWHKHDHLVIGTLAWLTSCEHTLIAQAAASFSASPLPSLSRKYLPLLQPPLCTSNTNEATQKCTRSNVTSDKILSSLYTSSSHLVSHLVSHLASHLASHLVRSRHWPLAGIRLGAGLKWHSSCNIIARYCLRNIASLCLLEICGRARGQRNLIRCDHSWQPTSKPTDDRRQLHPQLNI